MMNIAALPKEQQNAIQRDKTAALWAWQVKHKKATAEAIEERIRKLKDPEKIADMRQRFDRYRKVKTPFDPKPVATHTANTIGENKTTNVPGTGFNFLRKPTTDTRPEWMR